MLILLLGLAPLRAAADMLDSGSMKTWEHCALCHGLDGVSRMAKFPRLAGQTKAYLVKQLADFRFGRRANDGGMMHGAANQFPMNRLVEAAAYFSALPPPPSDSANDAALASRGRDIFHRGIAPAVPACAGCHGAAIAGSSGRPRLEAQHARYLRKQLTEFRDGERDNDTGGIMRAVAARLSDEDIAAVAAHLSQTERKSP